MFTKHAHKGEQRPGDYERTVDMLRRSDEENRLLRETINRVAKALPVLRTMCEVANLSMGAETAQQMLDDLASLYPNTKPQ